MVHSWKILNPLVEEKCVGVILVRTLPFPLWRMSIFLIIVRNFCRAAGRDDWSWKKVSHTVSWNVLFGVINTRKVLPWIWEGTNYQALKFPAIISTKELKTFKNYRTVLIKCQQIRKIYQAWNILLTMLTVESVKALHNDAFKSNSVKLYITSKVT